MLEQIRPVPAASHHAGSSQARSAGEPGRGRGSVRAAITTWFPDGHGRKSCVQHDLWQSTLQGDSLLEPAFCRAELDERRAAAGTGKSVSPRRRLSVSPRRRLKGKSADVPEASNWLSQTVLRPVRPPSIRQPAARLPESPATSLPSRYRPETSPTAGLPCRQGNRSRVAAGWTWRDRRL